MTLERRTYAFKLREVIERDAVVEAASLTEARKMLSAYARGEGGADMGGDAPIQLGDMQSVKMTFRLALENIVE